MNSCQFFWTFGMIDVKYCVFALSRSFFVGISVINALLSPYDLTYTPHLASDPMDYQFNFIFEC